VKSSVSGRKSTAVKITSDGKMTAVVKKIFV
jgi:hypothetical protein